MENKNLDKLLNQLDLTEDQYYTDALSNTIVQTLLQGEDPLNIIKWFINSHKTMEAQLHDLLLKKPSVKSHIASIRSRVQNGMINTVNGSDEMLVKQLSWIEQNVN